MEKNPIKTWIRRKKTAIARKKRVVTARCRTVGHPFDGRIGRESDKMGRDSGGNEKETDKVGQEPEEISLLRAFADWSHHLFIPSF
jgi:hypothetical protein